jgi:hypothetical protein
MTPIIKVLTTQLWGYDGNMSNIALPSVQSMRISGRTLVLLAFALFAALYAANYPLVNAENWRTFLGPDADSPYRYRVLTSSVILAGTALMGGPNAVTIYLVSIIGQIAGSILLVFAADAWLRRRHRNDHALLGVGLLILPMALMSRYPVLNPYSLVEAALFCIGALLITERRQWALWLVIALAVLNRETGVFLFLLWVLIERHRWRERSYWIWGALYTATFITIYGGLRFVLGPAPDAITVAMVLYRNLRDVHIWLPLVLLYMPFVILAILGAKRFSHGGAFLLVAGAYLALACVFGLLHETRLFLTPLALTMPLIVQSIRISSR